MNQQQAAFKDLMEKYNEKREAWIAFHGDAKGFDEWFTAQVNQISEKGGRA
jgi:hypothetical protein